MNKELVAVIMSNGTIDLEWIQSDTKPDPNKQKIEREIHRRFQENVASGLLFLGFHDSDLSLSLSLEFWREFAQFYAKKLSQTPDLETIRENVELTLEQSEAQEFLQKSPFMVGNEYLDIALLMFIWARLNRYLQEQIAAYSGKVKDLLLSYNPQIGFLGRVYFHLVENKNSDEFPFAFLATYSTALGKEGESKHLPLKCALEEYAGEQAQLLDLLTTVEMASQQSEFMEELLESGEIFHPLAWQAKEAFTFLKEIPLYEKCGILCRIPNWWKTNSSALRIHVAVGESPNTILGMDTLLNFDAQLLLGDQVITEQEARQILEQAQGLAYIKGKWVEVNEKKLQEILQAFSQVKQSIEQQNFTMRDAIKMQLGTHNLAHNGLQDDTLEISNGKWLQSVFEKLQQPQLIQDVPLDKSFHATLRHYQQHGLNWLHFLHSLQLGACLADDMGLGKTIQIIALLYSLSKNKKAKKLPHLLVIPASLLENWQSEIRRFAPSLKYFVVHPSYNPQLKNKKLTARELKSYDVLITTYNLVSRYKWLQDNSWDYVILDEAQAIKNPGTKQTTAVKKLKCLHRIAMTGTPIENRLSDLWSLYDFINPGLLGTAYEFTNFTKSLKNNKTGYSRLKKVISPYLLRRLKTDKTVISDLPDKIEMKTYAELSKKQILLYKKLVEDVRYSLQNLEGTHKRGVILGSLIKFKQICNHPGQYLGNGEFQEKDSGKLTRLREICETIYEKREKMLIFTQFKEITASLHDFLETIFERKGLILHGGTSVAKRKQIVERFQSKEYVPFFILSLKAGGVGLNLTAANHIVHFDRWWNPAVENQATDRAFRIGQNQTVIVHKFITKGTLEEKIDSLLEEKKSLSEEIIEGENWLGKMDDTEILELFKLSL